MNKYYDIEQLAAKVSGRIINKEDSKDYFEPGNVLETLNTKGKEEIKNITIQILEDDLNKAEDDSRKLLLEKQANMFLKKKLSTKQTSADYDAKIEDLQSKYQFASNTVKEINSYLERLK